jgi:hypothetical protein
MIFEAIALTAGAGAGWLAGFFWSAGIAEESKLELKQIIWAQNEKIRNYEEQTQQIRCKENNRRRDYLSQQKRGQALYRAKIFRRARGDKKPSIANEIQDGRK